MQRDPRAFLWDVREAAFAILNFTTGLDVTAYKNNELVQAAIERKFEVFGKHSTNSPNWMQPRPRCGPTCLKSWRFATN